MGLFTLKNRQDPWNFQEKAVSCIVRDFKQNMCGRFLLVLPTGGGKTLAAMRSVSEMIRQGMISSQDKVLWVVHTRSLYSHAKKNLENRFNYSKFSLHPDLKMIISVRMKSDALKELETGLKCRLIVIDEAHHAAANTYEAFFEYPLGILGLTATPHRMDRRKLPFAKVSYSITFRELVRRKVVLLPKFLPELRTDISIDANSLQEEYQLEGFNTEERNQLIAHYIFREAEKYKLKKIIVFVGTNSHVKSLYETLKRNNERAKNKFTHIGYIFGGDNNEKSISNERYLDWHHTQESSILVNCRILNEGYDDPNIDTVVMATPTNSILYYMQCVGRVVRAPGNNINASAHVIEIVDKLPNISYRIDNRWLFAEISDYLEPVIEDIRNFWPVYPIRVFVRLFAFRAKLSDLSRGEILALLTGKRINLLLFNDVPHNNFGKWRILSLPESDPERIKLFNELSENIEDYYNTNHDYLFEQKYPSIVGEMPINSRIYRSSMMAALYRAFTNKLERKRVDSLVYLSLN
ncbi:MAG: DEAD/DEAH box helicase family protein [Candidatus Omnitrophica bacterium]|nr:DEAD/DEAH box helicase family protein [Candidatus Omnitrophota bacterium]